jgi:SAM-dependent methyltransferase
MLKRVPLIGSVLMRVQGGSCTAPVSSACYWEDRYRSGGTSGEGSYGELAHFKAEVINAFVQAHGIQSVVEFGCGDGNQLALMRFPEYIGFDVSSAAVALCRQNFTGDATKRFVALDPESTSLGTYRADLVLSLDVIYHLVEDAAFDRYMNSMFDVARRFVIIYADDSHDEEQNARSAFHVRHRKFTQWIAENRPNWDLISHIPNRFPYNEQAGTGSWSEFWIYSCSSSSGQVLKTRLYLSALA